MFIGLDFISSKVTEFFDNNSGNSARNASSHCLDINKYSGHLAMPGI
jgi:hypothetical protein